MMAFIDHFHSFSHMMAYVVMFGFFAYYWKHQIWSAIKGYNGKIQLIELMKFGAIVAMFAHWIEWLFGQHEFDALATLVLLAIAIASHNSKIDLGNIVGKWVSARMGSAPAQERETEEEQPKGETIG